MQHASKPFFALARGVFPVHELCGAFTALNLVRRDILGQKIPTWRLLAPAVVLHSMANFRVRCCCCCCLPPAPAARPDDDGQAVHDDGKGSAWLCMTAAHHECFRACLAPHAGHEADLQVGIVSPLDRDAASGDD